MKCADYAAVIPGRRVSAGPGIHNSQPALMDSGLSAFGLAPE